MMAENEKAKQDLESKRVQTSSVRRSNDSVREQFLSVEKGIDLLFLMDVTGSMGSWLSQAQTKMKEIIAAQEGMMKGTKLRIAFIGYRDYCDQERHIKYDFVDPEDIQTLVTKIAPIAASGGGDTPEDIAGAYDLIRTLSWRSKIKLIIHFADAPCHGTDYHNLGRGRDSLPDGDSKYDRPEDILASICQQTRIDMYFTR